MALSHCKTTVELREISLKERPEALLLISPKGTVPVLKLPDNTILEESLDIMLWALNKNNSTWLESNMDIQKDMIFANDTDFKYYLDRYKYNDRYPKQSKKEYNKECKTFLRNYENKLSNTKFLLSNSIQFADVAIFPFLRQYVNVDKEYFIKSFPNLNRYLDDFCTSELFLSVMNKYALWEKNSEPLITNFH